MNHKLIVQLKQLVQTERKITAEIVELIKEIDRLKLYLSYGHTSMFAFLTKEVGYTPTSAIRRINAARILREVPELKENLKSGSINLSQASMMAEAIRKKQKEDSLQKANKDIAKDTDDAGKENMSIEISKEVHKGLSKEEKKDLLMKIQSLDLVMTEKILAQSLDLEIKTHEKKHFQKDESIRLEVTLTKEQWEDLQRVKELISHQNVNPSVSDLIGLLTKNYLDKNDPLRKVSQRKKVFQTKATAAPDASTQHPLANESQESCARENNKVIVKNRYIPEKIKQAIFKRDQSCQWVTKKRNQQGQIETTKCQSKFQMQVDHIQPKWLNGTNDAQNLQLLCAVHNKLKYQMELFSS